MHLAARFCAKEAVAKALGLTRLELPRRRGRGHRGGARGPPERPRGRARGRAGRRGQRLARRTPRTSARCRRTPRGEPLPDWLDPLYEAAEMRAVDAWAIEEQGVPSLDLMERAGVGLARVDRRGRRGRGPVRVVVGKGNNGGDGLVAARLLREDGHEVDVLAVGPLRRAARRRSRQPRAAARRSAGAVRSASASRARARSSTPCSARASRARRASRSRRRDRGDQRQRAPRWSPATCRRGRRVAPARSRARR